MQKHIPAAVIGDATLYHADCRDVLREMADNSIDSVVTDPPYALVSIVKRFGGKNAAPAKDGDVYARASAGFMGKQWDTGEVAFATEFWAEVLRVLKPGGHVVAFSGTRTYHRMVVAIEDAGFEIRDQLGWLYGSGFPKSHDVSKGIDARMLTGRSRTEDIRRLAMGDDYQPSGRGRVNYDHGGGSAMNGAADTNAPASDAARQWQGWGTALKPAWEPIVLARKPLIGTVAENVLRWGTGAINIDGCRITATDGVPVFGNKGQAALTCYGDGLHGSARTGDVHSGRWPANIVHDGSDEVVAAFPDSNGSGAARTLKRGKRDGEGWGMADEPGDLRDAGTGSAARFFYCAKASRKDREEGLDGFGRKTVGDGPAVAADNAYQRGSTPRANTHPTVKPTDLMRWLCRLVTPPGGVVLDPFMGSGSTGKAALLEGFRFIGCEREDEYMPIAAARIGRAAGHMEKDDVPAASVVPTAAAPAGATQQPAGNDNEPDLFSANDNAEVRACA